MINFVYNKIYQKKKTKQPLLNNDREKKPLLRHLASDYVLEDNKIWPKYREPFGIFAEGNKKCLEIKGKIPKSSKHLIWGTVINTFYNFLIQ